MVATCFCFTLKIKQVENENKIYSLSMTTNSIVFFRVDGVVCNNILALVCVCVCVCIVSTTRWRPAVVSCYVCNLLCTIDKVFLFTHVTTINMVATCFCFTLKIQSGRIRKQIVQDNCSLIQAKTAWTTDSVTAGYLMHFRYSSIRPIDGFSGKLIRVTTTCLIKYHLN